MLETYFSIQKVSKTDIALIFDMAFVLQQTVNIHISHKNYIQRNGMTYFMHGNENDVKNNNQVQKQKKYILFHILHKLIKNNLS